MANDNRSDLFGRRHVVPSRPVTADMCVIVWGTEGEDGARSGANAVTTVTSLSIQYQQQVIRRRTLGSRGGNPVAVIYPTQPSGSIQIQRLFADTPSDIFSYPGWDICKGTAALDITFDGESAFIDCGVKYGGFHITGATVTGYSISAEAEGLTIVDNVSIEFLQMMSTPRISS